MTDTPETVLKPCPFCGGLPDGPTFSAEVGEKDAYEVECQNCCFGLEGPAKRTTEAAKEAAIATWNARTPSSATPEVSELVERLRRNDYLNSDNGDWGRINPDGPEAAAALETYEVRVRVLETALRRVADMTDIEADFDGFEAREIARAALLKTASDAIAKARG